MPDPFDDDPLNALEPQAFVPAPGGVAARASAAIRPAPYLDSLNESQRMAVEALDGPVLVLAGAGTGKTRVLTTRLAHLMHSGRARSYQVLAVTFTNKAAREMRDRLADLVGGATDGLWLGTFHALSARILRRHAELVGLKSNFTILDTDDQIRLLKQVMEAEGVDQQRWPARLLIGTIQRWKDKGLTPDKVTPTEAGDFVNGRAVALYRAYQARLATLNATDFGDLLLHCLTLFTSQADVLKQYQSLFRYILVDEYQDTNVAQYLWLRLLAQAHRNICCVGDDDQSIYGWRGAEIGNILKFEKDFPGARVIRLERNYRSTPNILGAASGLIAHNQGRLGKTLWTDAPKGDPVRVRGVWDGEEEARVIGEEIEALHRRGHRLNEIAILVRAGFQTREFEERFLTLGIPYRVIGGPRFYEREEIRDAIAYLRVIHQPEDDLAFERILNKPARGIGPATVQTLHGAARALGRSLHAAALELVQTDELKPAARRSLSAILDDFGRWRRMGDGLGPVELAETVLDESGYTGMWQQSRKPEAPGRLENLKELVTALREFDTLAGFLEHVSLVMENVENQSDDMVSVMTLHAAKGLEFDIVFLPGWEEGLFPHQRAMDESGVAGLEEERRLAYVGLTRARRRAAISFAANRRIHNQWQAAIPSRFIDEIPPDHVLVESGGGLYGGLGESPRFAAEPASPGFGGPGWRRYHERASGGTRPQPQVIDAQAQYLEDAAAAFDAGDRCFHQKFGMGTVTAVDGSRLTIDFDHAGTKKVVAAYVQKPA